MVMVYSSISPASPPFPPGPPAPPGPFMLKPPVLDILEVILIERDDPLLTMISFYRRKFYILMLNNGSVFLSEALRHFVTRVSKR
jgi:hypothetical protein